MDGSKRHFDRLFVEVCDEWVRMRQVMHSVNYGFWLWIALGLASGVSAEWQLFVGAGAAAGGNGSQRAPYQSLTQARDAIRAARKVGTAKGVKAVTVWVGAGTYPLDASFQLTPEDSGSAGAEVVYRGQSPGQARICGGIALEAAAFKPVTDATVMARLDAEARDKVVVCDLSVRVPGTIEPIKNAYRGAPSGPWLYANGQPMTLARWPNIGVGVGGWAEFSKSADDGLPDAAAADSAHRAPHAGSFEFADPRPERWNLQEGVWLLGYWTHDWFDEVIRVGAYDKERKIITLAAPHPYGIMAGTWGSSKRRFFALNVLEELDVPGEWYVDRTLKRLYYYPSVPLRGSSLVLATLTEPLVKMDGVNYVKLVNLAFEYSHGNGLVLQNTQHVEIEGCVVSNSAGGGIAVTGSDNTVRSCDVFNLGRDGISLNGGDRKSLTMARNLAINNHIHDYGIFQRTYAPGIGVAGCGQMVRNNRIHDAPHNAILYGGNEHLFERNEIYRVVMETGDAGAIYTGRDWTSQGNVLRHNFIHNLGAGDSRLENTMGIYLDDCDSGDTIEGNVFYHAGRAIMIGGGRDNPVLNNLIVDCSTGLHIDARGMTWKQWNNPADASWCLEEKARQLNYTEPPWSVKYPRLSAIMKEEPRRPLNNPIRRNVMVDCTRKVLDFDANVMKCIDSFVMTDNWIVDTHGAPVGRAATKELMGWSRMEGTLDEPVVLGFRDVAHADFTLRKDARLLKEVPSFVPIPFHSIGLYQDDFRRVLPRR